MKFNDAIKILNEFKDDVSIYKGYSGRGMFGVETTGIITGYLEEVLEFCEKNEIPVRKDNFGYRYILY